MPPFDPTGNGAYVPVNRIKPITADFVGDATKGGASNLQDFVDAQRMLKAPCRALATSLPAYTRTENVITASDDGALDVDGVSADFRVGDRLLLNFGPPKAADTGVYTITALGSASSPFVLTRAADFSAAADAIHGLAIWVTGGTQYAGTLWKLSVISQTRTAVLNTTPLLFSQVQLSGSSGGGGGGGTDPAVQTFVDTRQALKAPCDVATSYNIQGDYENDSLTTANLEPFAEAGEIGKLDGVFVATGSRILVAKQTDTFQNGIYVIEQNGTSDTPTILRRAADAPTANTSAGVVTVLGGKKYGGTVWQLSTSVDPFSGSSRVFATKINPKRGAAYAHACAYVTTEDLSASFYSGNLLSGDGQLIISGATPSLNSLVLVAAQTNPQQNGIYRVETSGGLSSPYLLMREVAQEDLVSGLLVMGGAQLYCTRKTSAGHITFEPVSGGGGGSGDYVLKPQIDWFEGSPDDFCGIPSGRDNVTLINLPANANPLTVGLPAAPYNGQKVTIKDAAGNFGDSVDVRVVPALGTESIDNQYTTDSPLALHVSHMSITFTYYGGVWYLI